MSADDEEERNTMSTDEEEGSSLSEHLHRRFVRLVDGEEDSELEEMVCETDAYVIISGKCQGHLPALDWNQHFRKAYTLLLWLRVVAEDVKEEEHKGKEEIEKEDEKEEGEDEPDTTPPPRILYRFATSPDDSEATGICVTCSDWKLSDEGGQLETDLTATALNPMGTSTPLKTTLRLNTNTWHLVGFTHVFPYLKKPTWTVTVDGQAVGTGELSYPLLTEKNSPSSMEYNTILHNLVSDNNQFQLHIAALSLYPLSIGSGIQAVVAEAGPNMALTSRDGRILPMLPPVANW
jgi:hypothetical protein